MNVSESDLKIYSPVVECPQVDSGIVPAEEISWRKGVLIRASNWLGDTLMGLPAAWALRSLMPEECDFFVMCPRALEPVWQSVPWVSETVPMAGKRAGRFCRRTLRRIEPGVAVVFPNSFGSAVDIFGVGIPLRMGRAGRGRRVLLTHSIREWPRERSEGARRHQLSNYLELAGAFGPVSYEADMRHLSVSRSDQIASELLNDGDSAEPLLVLAPGAAYGPAKQWPVESFGQVAVWWNSQKGRTAVVGTGDERSAGSQICRHAPGTLNLAGETDLGGLMAVLQAATCVVANDSGAMHLAAGLGTPGIAVFGSTDPVATGPLGAPWIVLEKNLDCGPCFQRTCKRSDTPYECLTVILPKTVCAAIPLLLDASREDPLRS